MSFHFATLIFQIVHLILHYFEQAGDAFFALFFVPLFIIGEILFVLILSIDLQNALFVRLSFFLSSSFRGLALNQKFVVVVEVLHVEERLVGHAEG